MERLGFRQFVILACALLGLVRTASAGVIFSSATLDPESASGQTTNAPGAWSTNLSDPLSPLGVQSGGTFLNIPGSGFDLGEISITLTPGLNTFRLFGNTLHPENLFYGAILFFDGAVVPQIAVYNSNGGIGPFQVQAAGTPVIGSANGGSFFNLAPGSSVYTAPDGSTVGVVAFTVDSIHPGVDQIGFATIGPDGRFDTTADLTLRYNPIPEPAAAMLVVAGLAMFTVRLRSRRQ